MCRGRARCDPWRPCLGDADDENASALRADRNVVGGNVQAFKTTGGVAIKDNHIDGNLQCKKKWPPPTGGGNVV